MKNRLKSKNHLFMVITIAMISFYSGNAQVNVNTLEQLRTAVLESDQEIIMQAGNYNLEDLNVRIKIFTKAVLSDDEIDLSSLASYGYFAEVKGGSSKKILKLIKK